MNPYLSRSEKDSFVRLVIMLEEIEEVINIYDTVKSVDKTFLADLRHARTRVDKAVKKRLSYLTDQAKTELLIATEKIECLFMPKLEAKRAHAELLKMKSTLPMDVDDFYDWYSFVIDHTCISCTAPNYEECPGRKVLIKYNVCPVNPEAVGCCQYSYVPEQGVGGEALLKAKTG